HFAGTATFDDRPLAAIALLGDAVWASVAFTEGQGSSSVSVGGGLHFSTDHGITWIYVPQPVDVGTVDTLDYGINRIPALAVTVPQQNVTYDIALSADEVWIASFAGMLRKSTDLGRTWQRVILPPDGLSSIAPTDTLDFALSPSSGALGLQGNLNHRVFSVKIASDSSIWVGTANGINTSTDGGVSWVKFNHQNQSSAISGNFVVAISEQRLPNKRLIWAATVNAVEPDEVQGVSFTDNDGQSWKTTLLGQRAHNISFKDSIVYVATNRGLFRSADFGTTWILSGTIADPSNGQRFAQPEIYAVGAVGDTIWAGGPEGMAYTIDSLGDPFGQRWKIFRTYESVGFSRTTYSFPSPFSPGDEVVRVHYSTSGQQGSVTIRVYDFAMVPVRTLLQNADSSPNVEHEEIWDGRDDYGRFVANGVYFYRIEIGGSDPLWGKIFVVQ
ncbi:MAG: exo-alpha-sialidase, partial [Proteobacteria bacterium]|nr:exo-alpha-sialidase [Pseudomonadota bacterium]